MLAHGISMMSSSPTMPPPFQQCSNELWIGEAKPRPNHTIIPMTVFIECTQYNIYITEKPLNEKRRCMGWLIASRKSMETRDEISTICE